MTPGVTCPFVSSDRRPEHGSWPMKTAPPVSPPIDTINLTRRPARCDRSNLRSHSEDPVTIGTFVRWDADAEKIDMKSSRRSLPEVEFDIPTARWLSNYWVRSHSSTLRLSSRDCGISPALLIMTSMRENVCTAVSTNLFTWSRRMTSVVTASALPPLPVNSLA